MNYHHLTPSRQAGVKKTQITGVGVDVTAKKPSSTADRNND